MKRSITILLGLIIVILVYFPVLAVDGKPAEKVVAYYFHGSFRCPTCTSMEGYTKEAIDKNFKDALGSGRLEFKTINIEEAGNDHFIKEYQLYTKTLILSLVKDGKEVKSKNLDKIWEYARNKQKFVDYVTAEIGGFLKDIN